MMYDLLTLFKCDFETNGAVFTMHYRRQLIGIFFLTKCGLLGFGEDIPAGSEQLGEHSMPRINWGGFKICGLRL